MKNLFLIIFLISNFANAYTPIDEVKVYKSQHRMDLLFQNKIIKSYKVMLGSGGKGAKQVEGDRLVPEGQYVLDEKNPNSKYHRSIHISYPNEQDIERSQRDGTNPGGEVFIHGLPNTNSKFVAWLRAKLLKIKHIDWTKGCVAVSDREIEEIYDNLPTPTPITIYP